MRQSPKRGTVVVEVVLWVAVLGAVGWFGKSLLFNGDKRRAKESVETTLQLLEAQTAQSEAVAASVVSIGEANQEAPESPSKAFIEREVPEALALLPEPPKNLLKEAESRRLAVMEGRLHEANRLYAELRDQNIVLQDQRNAAISNKIRADKEIVEAARLSSQNDIRNAILLGVAGLLAFGWITRARQSIPLAVLGQNLAHAGRPPEMVKHLDAHLTPAQQKHVRKHLNKNIQHDD